VINLTGVTHHYGVRPVLRDVTLHVKEGELVAVMGPNGMGKSTLLGVVAGVLCPLKGNVQIAGLARRSTVANECSIRQQVAYLPDHPWLPKNMTGREYLNAVGRLYDVDIERLMEHVVRLLSLFDLTAQADSPIRVYSNGQQKKIALCGTLATEARVLVLDEPFTGGLDPSAIMALRRVLERLASRKDVTVLMATQIPELAQALAHRVAVLRNGTIVAYDSVNALREQTQCSGSLGDILERMIHPESLERIDRYFERRST